MKKQKVIKKIVKHLENFIDIKLKNIYLGNEVLIKTHKSEILFILRNNLWGAKGGLQIGSNRYQLSATEYYLLRALINSKLGSKL